MRGLRQSLATCIANRNWYAALCVSLTLPDICARVEFPGENSSHRRYASWFDAYIRPAYTHRIGPGREERVFLSGNDCYALRCAFLHEGSDDITRQRAREAVERFLFIVAPPGFTIHCNMINAKLQLQVDIFCQDIAAGVDVWLAQAECDGLKAHEISAGLAIQLPGPNGGMQI